MYEAKAARRGEPERSVTTRQRNANERRRLADDLAVGLQRGEVVAYLQPIVSLGDGTTTGLEALVRWHHPELGLLSPASFLDLAEDAGLDLLMGDIVLRSACAVMADLDPAITLSMNLSVAQLADRQLCTRVSAILEEYQLGPERLMVEITEHATLARSPGGGRVSPEHTIEELRALGAALCLDDFGTGYSSLTHIRRYPLTAIKIDRSFVAGVLRSPGRPGRHRRHGRAWPARWNSRSSAKGSRPPSSSPRCEEIGCDKAQGYLIARPIPPEAVVSWVRAHGHDWRAVRTAPLAPDDRHPPAAQSRHRPRMSNRWCDDLEAAGVGEGRDLTLDELLQPPTRLEVNHHAAPGADEVMVMMLGELLGELVTIAARRPRHPCDDPGVDELGEDAVHGRHRHADGGAPPPRWRAADPQSPARRAHRDRWVVSRSSWRTRTGSTAATVEALRVGVVERARARHVRRLLERAFRRIENDSHSRYRRRVHPRLALVLLALGLTTTACATPPRADDGRVVVAASFYPVEDILREVGGDVVRVVTLVPPGQDADEFEPTPKQLTGLERADAVVYLGRRVPTQPGEGHRGAPTVGPPGRSAPRPIAAARHGTTRRHARATSTANPIGDHRDPHVWLDPLRMAAMADQVAIVLRSPRTRRTPPASTPVLAAYHARAGRTAPRLRRRSRRLPLTGPRHQPSRVRLPGAPVRSRAGVDRRHLVHRRTLGRAAAAVADYVRTHAVVDRVLPTEPAERPRPHRRRRGGHTRIAMLDSLEAPTHEQLDAHADYVSLMRANLTTLRAGLGCT